MTALFINMKPADYKYDLPDGYTLKPQTRMQLDLIVEEAGLSNAQSQKFIDLHVELTEEFAKELLASITPMQIIIYKIHKLLKGK